MEKVDIEYNSAKADIRYPEYGRSVQEMLEHAKNITDPRQRQKTVESIVYLMQLLNPANRNIEDYKERLWNHAFAIANYELDVTPPPGIVVRKESDKIKPEPVPYPPTAKRFRHYGNNVQKLIERAKEFPEGSKKEGFVEVIASYMKLAYKTWNKEHYVSDDVVKDDLEILSDGQLALHEGHSSLDTLAASANLRDNENKAGRRNNNNRNYKKDGGKRSNNNRNSGGGNNYGYKKRKK